MILTHAPEDPVQETWQWQTDKLVSDNGTEQRIDNCKYPQRIFQENVTFTDETSLRSFLLGMFGFGTSFDRPLFVYQARLTADVALGAGALAFNAALTEVRDGGKLYLYDAAGGELLTANVVTSGGCTLLAGPLRAYAKGAIVVPVTRMMSGNNAAMNRLNPDYAAQAQLTFREIAFLKPFVNPFNTEPLVDLAGLPILSRRPIGTGFQDQYDTGIQVFDSGGAVDIRNPWKHAQIVAQRTFLCHRILDPADWNWWRVFADYARGSCNPFWMPTWRQDFDLVTPPAPAGTTLTFGGTDYASTYFLAQAFRGVMITTAGGTHYATVTGAVAAGGNSNVTFDPALPSGAGWDTVQSVSMLLKARIADDKVVCYHGGIDTQLQLNLRTVDA